MSCSSSEAAAPRVAADPHRAALSPRLAAALAASVALHTLLVAAIEAPFGARWGAISWTSPGVAPIRAVLRGVAGDAGTPQPVAPQSVGQAPGAVSGAVPGDDAPRSLLPDIRYYRTRELDVRPGIMTRVQPEYPESAARRFLSGRVVLRLYLSETGAVERVAILRAEPPGHFEQAAERAFRAARFSPGMKGGRPVKVQMALEVSFDSPPQPAPERP